MSEGTGRGRYGHGWSRRPYGGYGRGLSDQARPRLVFSSSVTWSFGGRRFSRRITVGAWMLDAVPPRLSIVGSTRRRPRTAGLPCSSDLVVGLLLIHVPVPGTPVDVVVITFGLGTLARIGLRTYRRTERSLTAPGSPRHHVHPNGQPVTRRPCRLRRSFAGRFRYSLLRTGRRCRL